MPSAWRRKIRKCFGMWTRQSSKYFRHLRGQRFLALFGEEKTICCFPFLWCGKLERWRQAAGLIQACIKAWGRPISGPFWLRTFHLWRFNKKMPTERASDEKANPSCKVLHSYFIMAFGSDGAIHVRQRLFEHGQAKDCQHPIVWILPKNRRNSGNWGRLSEEEFWLNNYCNRKCR